MKKLICLFLVLAATAFAGDREGGGSTGGGDAVVLRNQKGKVVKAEVYDLFEGREYYGRTFTLSSAPFKEQALQRVRAKLGTIQSPSLRFIEPAIEDVFGRLRLLGLRSRPSDIDDAKMLVVPEEGYGEIEQLGLYTEKGELLVSRAIWAKLDETNRAAFLIHETVYKLLREVRGHTDSVLARNITSAIMSDQPINSDLLKVLGSTPGPKKSCGMVPANATRCWAKGFYRHGGVKTKEWDSVEPDFAFTVFPSPENAGAVRLQFEGSADYPQLHEVCFDIEPSKASSYLLESGLLTIVSHYGLDLSGGFFLIVNSAKLDKKRLRALGGKDVKLSPDYPGYADVFGYGMSLAIYSGSDVGKGAMGKDVVCR